MVTGATIARNTSVLRRSNTLRNLALATTKATPLGQIAVRLQTADSSRYPQSTHRVLYRALLLSLSFYVCVTATLQAVVASGSL